MDKRLLSYPIASSDMRFIPVNERELYLRETPDGVLIIRGEIAGCGADCYVSLGQALFEYAVSCEDCKDHLASAGMMKQFCQHLGQELLAALEPKQGQLSDEIQIQEAMSLILRSMEVDYSAVEDGQQIRFELVECPVHKGAVEPGYRLQLPIVRLGFLTLCEEISGGLAAGWRLVSPEVEESDQRLEYIQFSPDAAVRAGK